MPRAHTQPPPLLVGALAPLSAPGWTEAGTHLIAGLELGVRTVNAQGGVEGRPLAVMVRDTAANPMIAMEAVVEMHRLGALVITGEFHSVVAKRVATKAHELGMPFLCSSAVLDKLTEQPSPWVARICAPQSRGWSAFARHLAACGAKRVAIAAQPGEYWESGAKILDRVLQNSASTLHIDLAAAPQPDVLDTLVDAEVDSLLVLAGYPEPILPLVDQVRRDPRLADLWVGAPAGQPEFSGWLSGLGHEGAGIPFLRYLPEILPPLGAQVSSQLTRELDAAPSFVAFEGFDSALAVADLLNRSKSGSAWTATPWSGVEVQGTRGTIRFALRPGATVWEWMNAPVQIAERDPAGPAHFREATIEPS